MIRKIFSAHKDIIAFLLIFLLLGIFASRLAIYFDDANYIFPSIYGNYTTHFHNYIRDNGIQRPLALFYYYFIFTLYLWLPAIAHLIPLLLYSLSAILLYKILRMQLFSNKIALFTSLLVLSIPFAVESFGWFSASVGIVAIFLFFLQVYVIEKYFFTIYTLYLLFCINFISSFFYETTLFMSLALSKLWLDKQEIFQKRKFKFQNYLLLTTTLLIPTFVYLIVRAIVPSQLETEFAINKSSTILSNWNNYIPHLTELFLTKGPRLFWINESIAGISKILDTPLTFIVFITLIFLIIHELFFEKMNSNLQKPSRSVQNFWIIALIATLVPLAWKQYYLPFRTLILPTVLLLVVITLFVKNLLYKIRNSPIFEDAKVFIKLLVLFTLTLFLSLQVKMLSNLKLQYDYDIKIVNEINSKNIELGFNPTHRTNIFIKNFPNNTVSSFVYGDYIFSMFQHFWVAAGFVDLNSGTVKDIAIERKEKNIFSGKYDRETFLSLRPITVFEYSGDKNCLVSHCLRFLEVKR